MPNNEMSPTDIWSDTQNHYIANIGKYPFEYDLLFGFNVRI